MIFSPDNFENEFEDAIRILTNAMPPAEKLIKPTLLHSLRVAVYLYTHGYNRITCLAGLLHDAIEDTKITFDDIEKKFGTDVAVLVQANTKNNTLEGFEKYEDLIRRCIKAGETGAIIKATDIVDNYVYFQKIDHIDGKEWMIKTGTILLNSLPTDYKDPIFYTLKELIII
ncbi:MAG: HD domain-containing protein [Candidatus Roizmanbacteria bacterium]